MSKGFTMIELLVVFAIIGFLTAIIVYRYGKFNTQIDLVNTAYEVAFVIREAQLAGITTASDLGLSADTFDYDAYGVHFSSVTNNEKNKLIKIFLDDNDNGICDLDCSCDGGECIQYYELPASVSIDRLIYDENGIGDDCNKDDDNLYISFERPSPDPIININGANQALAQIDLINREGEKMHVSVRTSGQIGVFTGNDDNIPCR